MLALLRMCRFFEVSYFFFFVAFLAVVFFPFFFAGIDWVTSFRLGVARARLQAVTRFDRPQYIVAIEGVKTPHENNRTTCRGRNPRGTD